MKKVLIFGVNGFTGIHLWNYLKNVEKREIIGTYNRKLDLHRKRFLKGCRLKNCNIDNYSQIKKILKNTQPEQIYFLPAIVTVAGSFARAVTICNTNVLGTAKFFEATIESGIKSKILVTGSAEEYGKVKKSELPIKEKHPLTPVNPYGVSKALQEQLAWCYAKNHGLNINMTRTFHFAGPLQPSSFVVSDFAHQVAQIEAGLMKPLISVGNLNAKRDFTDIRDVVKAYYLIMNKVIKGPEIFNVCSGWSVSIKTILNKLLSMAYVRITIKKDPAKMRKSDVPDFRGDNTRLVKETGWRPDFILDRTLTDVLNWHRARFKRRLTRR